MKDVCALKADSQHECSRVLSTLDAASCARIARHAEERALRYALRTQERAAVFNVMKRWACDPALWRAPELVHPVVRAALVWEMGLGGEPCAAARWMEAGGPDTEACRGVRVVWAAQLMARFAIWEVSRAGTRTCAIRNLRSGALRAVEGMSGYLEGDVFCARIVEAGSRPALLGETDGSSVIEADAQAVRARLGAFGGARSLTTQEIFEAYWNDTVPGGRAYGMASGLMSNG